MHSIQRGIGVPNINRALPPEKSNVSQFILAVAMLRVNRLGSTLCDKFEVICYTERLCLVFDSRARCIKAIDIREQAAYATNVQGA